MSRYPSSHGAATVHHSSAGPANSSAHAPTSTLASAAASSSAMINESAGDGIGSANTGQHKRVYQACIPCRRRKVRCDLGSVDDPHDPPCVRCRRESKECYFSATRRKRKNEDAEDEHEDEYIVRNGRKRHHLDRSPSFSYPTSTHGPGPDRPQAHSNTPLTPGGSSGRSQPLRRPDSAGMDTKLHPINTNTHQAAFEDNGPEPNAPMENLEARSLMRRELYGPHDALDLLYKAATDSPHHHEMHEHERHRNRNKSISTIQPSPVSAPSHKPRVDQPSHRHSASTGHVQSRWPDHIIDPRILNGSNGSNESNGSDGTNGFNGANGSSGLNAFNGSKDDESQDPQTVESRVDLSKEEGYQDALRAWSRFRFVRAGWFTKEEAVKYIAYYYEFLSPMTPISPPTFRSPASHLTLLTDEPVLSVTLLTISSRYYKLPGSSGHCRSHAIHEELWRYLRRMIERCLWGQEAFGNGFCGYGVNESQAFESQTSSTAPWRGMRKGSLRTLGTIESLMILTEWHPRALHFPPDEATDELMLPTYDLLDQHRDQDQNPDGHEAQQLGGGVGGRRIESWLEPAWRSDRMCWMLLSTGMGLAYELGVFDDIDEMLADNAITRPEYEDEGYRLRATRIKRLLLIYLTQLAGRLGWTNMVPESIRQTDPALSRKLPSSIEGGGTPGTASATSNAFSYVLDVELDDQLIYAWVGVSNAMHIGNQRLFRSRNHTTEIIKSGRYTTLLKEFQPILREWWLQFEKMRLPQFIRHILTIEYEYVRIYINSLALQAVVERCTNNAGNTSSSGQNGSSNGTSSMLSPQTQNFLGTLPLGHLGGFGSEDQEYVKEVVDGSRNLLRTVVDGLLPQGYLKHAPVRTYFRIISGAMFLLKTFALGAPKSDVEFSITLMDRTVEALRNCVVDDVHLGTRFGDLLESLTGRLRDRFKYAPMTSVSAEGRSPRAYGESSKAASVNGAGGPNGPDNNSNNSYHPLKLRDGLVAPDRAVTPSLPITATPWDANNGPFPVPPGSSSIFQPHPQPPTAGGLDSHNNMSDNMFDSEWNNPEDQMWYLPAGPGFFQNVGENTNVTMTDQGVNVGGLDLLEYMAMDNHQFSTETGGYGAGIGG